MIKICIQELDDLDLKINVTKTICIGFGNSVKNHACSEMTVCANKICWSMSLKYLGLIMKSASRFTVDLKPSRAKFYRSFNAIYNKIAKANEMTIMSLVKTFCVPESSSSNNGDSTFGFMRHYKFPSFSLH